MMTRDLDVMKGKSAALTLPRRFIADLCWLSLRVPVAVVAGTMNIGPLVAMRRSRAEPPPYTAMLAKAMAIVAVELPELRRMYTSLPWPRLFEAEESAASIIVERWLEGELAVLPVLVKRPASQSLEQIARTIRAGRDDDIASVRHLHRIVTVTRLPLPLRRALWLIAYGSGRLRSNHFGTFGISTVGQHGVLITRHLSPVTTCLALGPIDAAGRVTVTIDFDHRVYDAALAARTLVLLEAALNGPIVEELSRFPSTAQAGEAAE